MNNAQGIIEYSYDILPKESGESIIVHSIGLIALGDNYKVEMLTGNGIYKITEN